MTHWKRITVLMSMLLMVLIGVTGTMIVHSTEQKRQLHELSEVIGEKNIEIGRLEVKVIYLGSELEGWIRINEPPFDN